MLILLFKYSLDSGRKSCMPHMEWTDMYFSLEILSLLLLLIYTIDEALFFNRWSNRRRITACFPPLLRPQGKEIWLTCRWKDLSQAWEKKFQDQHDQYTQKQVIKGGNGKTLPSFSHKDLKVSIYSHLYSETWIKPSWELMSTFITP